MACRLRNLFRRSRPRARKGAARVAEGGPRIAQAEPASMRPPHDLEWNRTKWNEHNWSRRGDEWSDPWGTSEAQWYGTLLPRLRSFVPARTILEIAPGHGRWTQYLAPLSERYYGVDISSTCIDHCRQTFPGPHMEFFVNDGRSLEMVPDDAVDLCFSFDSLVHVEIDVMETYIYQIVRKLTAGGVAFIHHSNFAEFNPKGSKKHHRAESVSASAVRDLVKGAGGQTLRHEIISWRGVQGLDAILLFARAGAYDGETAVVPNPLFPDEAKYIRTAIAPWSFRRAVRRAE